MADITNYMLARHLRAEPSSHVIHYKNGRPRTSARGASFWFLPLAAAIVEIPVDDRELAFLFHGRSADFQDIVVQGVLTYRVVEPATLADRVDFGVDLRSGKHCREPLQQLSGMLTQLAQQFALDYVTVTDVRELLGDGHERIRQRIKAGLLGDDTLSALGLELVSVRLSAIRPSADLEKALEAPAREQIQQRADEAGFARRAMAVEKERAIAENELESRIELARREQKLIAERGANRRRQAEEKAEAERIAADGQARCATLEATGEAEALRLVETARLEAERERMAIHRDLPTPVLFGLAAQALAGKLERIDHLSLGPDALGPLLTNLVRASTAKLEAEVDEDASR